MDIRFYQDEDQRQVLRVWTEIGWAASEEDTRKLIPLLAAGAGIVGILGDEVECFVSTAPGTMRYQDRSLRCSAISSVATGRIARKQSLAGRTTAWAVARAAEAGAAVCALTTFELGYYNRMGFGTGNYLHHLTLDPAALHVPVKARAPLRLGLDDWREIHAARLQRWRGHGSCNMDAPELTLTDMTETGPTFGLGYRDEHSGELTHYLWISPDTLRAGPYNVRWFVFRNRAQFLELMALLRNLGDQVQAVRLWEAPYLRVLDLVRNPRRSYRITQGSTFATGVQAQAYWQMRILDLATCLAQTALPGGQLRFNLDLHDPIERFLEEGDWRGVGGRYVVTLGPQSSAVPGERPDLPTLTASVGAFTRLWLGVAPASGISLTDDLSGPDDLLAALDALVRLPIPDPDWLF